VNEQRDYTTRRVRKLRSGVISLERGE
jgi:hypothetical protein